jgi:hypothetical protein
MTKEQMVLQSKKEFEDVAWMIKGFIPKWRDYFYRVAVEILKEAKRGDEYGWRGFLDCFNEAVEIVHWDEEKQDSVEVAKAVEDAFVNGGCYPPF